VDGKEKVVVVDGKEKVVVDGVENSWELRIRHKIKTCNESRKRGKSL
jgi:hypothetical protein